MPVTVRPGPFQPGRRGPDLGTELPGLGQPGAVHRLVAGLGRLHGGVRRRALLGQALDEPLVASDPVLDRVVAVGDRLELRPARSRSTVVQPTRRSARVAASRSRPALSAICTAVPSSVVGCPVWYDRRASRDQLVPDLVVATVQAVRDLVRGGELGVDLPVRRRSLDGVLPELGHHPLLPGDLGDRLVGPEEPPARGPHRRAALVVDQVAGGRGPRDDRSRVGRTALPRTHARPVRNRVVVGRERSRRQWRRCHRSTRSRARADPTRTAVPPDRRHRRR